MKLKLPNVTLFTVDCIDLERTLFAIYESIENIEFGQVIIATSLDYGVYLQDKRITFKSIRPIRNLYEYSNFMVKKLNDYINTDYVLTIQWDGFVLNPKAWSNRYLNYDYIGAVWLNRENIYGNGIGNGGFSLRSKRLIKFLAETSEKELNCYPEDRYVSIVANKYFNPAPKSIANRFSTESKYQGSFGFHNIYLTDFKTYQYLNRTKIITRESEPSGLTAVHSGDMGDIIYSLPVIKAKGVKKLILNTRLDWGVSFDYRKARAIQPLLESQGLEVIIQHGYNPIKVDLNLDNFRRYYNLNTIHLTDVYGVYFSEYIDHTKQFVSLDNIGEYEPEWRYIAINMTERYRNPLFDMAKLLKDINIKLVFLGMENEYLMTKARYPELDIIYMPTRNLLEAAKIIDKSEIFIGNQSVLYSIAEGLKHPRILEVCPYCPNCNSLYSRNYLIKTADDVEYGNKIVRGEVKL